MVNNLPYDEKEMFLQLSEGNEVVFTKLFLTYSRILHPFVTKLLKSSDLSEEIIQQTFLKLWLNRDKLADVEYPRAYIFRIASNECFAHFRKKIQEEKIFFEVNRNSAEESINTIEQNFTAKEINKLIYTVVKKLPSKQQHIFNLSRQKQLKIPQIASLLGISPHTVKNSLVKSLKIIRTHLENEGYYLPMLLIIIFL